MHEINCRVRYARKRNGYTQDDIAEILEINPSTFSQMERTGKISVEVLKKLSESLNIDIRYFIYGDEFWDKKEEPKPPPKPPEPPYFSELPHEDYLLTEKERYIVLTFRNLNNKEKREAYSLFMENFNMNIIHKKRLEEKRRKREMQKT